MSGSLKNFRPREIPCLRKNYKFWTLPVGHPRSGLFLLDSDPVGRDPGPVGALGMETAFAKEGGDLPGTFTVDLFKAEYHFHSILPEKNFPENQEGLGLSGAMRKFGFLRAHR